MYQRTFPFIVGAHLPVLEMPGGRRGGETRPLLTVPRDFRPRHSSESRGSLSLSLPSYRYRNKMTGSSTSLAAILARAKENDWGTNDPDVAARVARVPRGPKNKEVCRSSSSTSPTFTTSPNSLCDQSTMAERKVLSKYYPPDFDPSAIEKKKRSRKDGKPEPKLVPVRLMTPFAMKCTHCGEYIPKSRKFNGRKEILDEKYIGIVIHRFYIRCSRCSGEITFRTDPKSEF